MSLRVPLAQLRPDPQQPRRHFRQSALAALATSLKKAGQRQPITVRKRGDGAKPPYEIIDGERRWRAAKLAGLATVRIEIEETELTTHADQHLLSLTSNFIREGHTHMEVSNALKYQVDAMMAAGHEHRQAIQALTEALGKSETWVYQYLQIQQLIPELQERMDPDTPDEKRLRLTEAIVLSPLTATLQRSIYRALQKYPPGARTQQAKRLIAQATNTPLQRRQNNIKASTTRFVLRVAAEIDRVLEYKQADFAQGLRAVPEADRTAFRSSVKLLLDAIDRANNSTGRTP